MIDDATVFRLGQDNFRFVGGDDYDGVWLKEQAEQRGLNVWVKPSTDQLHNVAVQGPASREILARSSGRRRRSRRSPSWGGSGSSWGGCGRRTGSRSWSRGPATPASSATRSGATRRRRGRVGRDLGGRSAARAHAVRPGRAGHRSDRGGPDRRGNEYDQQVDPFEAGIGFAVDLRGDEDFVGRAALEERKAHPQRALVGLEVEGNEAAGHGDPVFVGRQEIGVVTSGTRSPVLKTTIALARLAVGFSELGTGVEVGKLDGQQKRIPATVVRFPFYDPEKTRPRS